MKEQIEARFQRNLERVQALLELYRAGITGAGHPPVHQADVLRAAVVFLHATLEDVVRSSLEWRLPDAAPEHLVEVTLLGCERRSKFTLVDLARHRGKTVAELLAESVIESLERSSFNQVNDLALALRRIQMDPLAILASHGDDLDGMMKRRHWIVHRADRDQQPGSDHLRTRLLSPMTVETWKNAVERFGAALLGAL